MLETLQVRRVSETMETVRRWSGFVCPDCRFVFRVPRDHDGKGIVCPSCRRILRIPGAGDVPPPLLATLRRVDVDAESTEPEPQKVRRKKRRRKVDELKNIEWENQSRGSRRGENWQMKWMLIGGVALFILMVTGIVLALRKGPQATPQVVATANPQSATSSKILEPAVTVRGENTIIAEAEPLVSKFLNATQVDEILPLVRDVKLNEARIRQFYPNGKIAAIGIARFNTTGQLTSQGQAWQLGVTTRDQDEKFIILIDSSDGLKVDWESWVGWSDMPWDKFMATKPTTSHLFRVKFSPVEYYNFGFSDDQKWQSCRLESPNGESSIYGYIEKGSLLDIQIRAFKDTKFAFLILLLKYPSDANSPKQVLIERLVSDSWVLANEAP